MTLEQQKAYELRDEFGDEFAIKAADLALSMIKEAMFYKQSKREFWFGVKCELLKIIK